MLRVTVVQWSPMFEQCLLRVVNTTAGADGTSVLGLGHA